MRFRLNKQSKRIQIFNNLLPGRISFHSLVFPAILIDISAVIQYFDHFKSVASANFKVIGIMCRCNLNSTRSEPKLYVLVCNNWDFFIHQW